jgi:hypothetical protein
MNRPNREIVNAKQQMDRLNRHLSNPMQQVVNLKWFPKENNQPLFRPLPGNRACDRGTASSMTAKRCRP